MNLRALLPFLLAATSLSATALACRCMSLEDKDVTRVAETSRCCIKFGGRTSKDGGIDCVAHSIRDKLNSFWRCCKENHSLSDCYDIHSLEDLEA